eukprot:Trichotokara_eunicae@DN6078_c0_g1_i4.p1
MLARISPELVYYWLGCTEQERRSRVICPTPTRPELSPPSVFFLQQLTARPELENRPPAQALMSVDSSSAACDLLKPETTSETSDAEEDLDSSEPALVLPGEDLLEDMSESKDEEDISPFCSPVNESGFEIGSDWVNKNH